MYPQDGGTALIMSAQYGHLDTTRLLLDSKADINAATQVFFTTTPVGWDSDCG